MTKADRNREIASRVDGILREYFDGERTGFALAFTEPPEYMEAGYVANIERMQAADLMESVAGNLRAKQN